MGNYNMEVAKQFYENFANWSSKKTENLSYIKDNYDKKGMSSIYDEVYKDDLSSDKKEERNNAVKNDIEKRGKEKQLGSGYDLTDAMSIIMESEQDEAVKQEIKDGMENNKYYEYYMLGIGEVLTYDTDGDNQLTFEEFLKGEKGEDSDPNDKDFMTQALKATFDSIASYNNEIEADNDSKGQYISMSEMTHYYYAYDKIDEDIHNYEMQDFDKTILDGISKDKPDGDKVLTKGNSFDDLTAEVPTIVIDAWSSEENNNNDCPSRLVYNIYGLDYYSEEGQEIWNKIKKLNPGVDENHFYANTELKLPY